MAVAPTYPGVYVEELPSGVRTITGVATSITAFIGRSRRGPDNEPVRIQSFGDFERVFGGLWFHSTMSYAVRHFFQNGGGDALIVRIAHGEAAVIELVTAADPLRLQAAMAGPLGNRLQAEVTVAGADTTVTLREIVSAGGSDFTVNEVAYTADNIGDLVAAINADGRLATVLEPAPTALPTAAAAAAFADGDEGAVSALAHLPVTSETLTLTAAAVGDAGNDLHVSIIPSATDADAFVLLVESIDDAGTVTTSEAHNLASVAGLGAALGLPANTLLDGTVAATSVRPAAVTRARLAGGNATAAATVDLVAPTAVKDQAASSPGAGGNALREVDDNNTAEPADPELYNLAVD